MVEDDTCPILGVARDAPDQWCDKGERTLPLIGKPLLEDLLGLNLFGPIMELPRSPVVAWPAVAVRELVAHDQVERKAGSLQVGLGGQDNRAAERPPDSAGERYANGELGTRALGAHLLLIEGVHYGQLAPVRVVELRRRDEHIAGPGSCRRVGEQHKGEYGEDLQHVTNRGPFFPPKPCERSSR